VKRQIVLVAHNIRSTHNVGSLLRTGDGLGIQTLYFTGHTPYPTHANDERLPHLATKLNSQIHKTALGAETSLPWEYRSNIEELLNNLKEDGFAIVALEQTASSILLPNFAPPTKLALIVGREVEGIEHEVLKMSDLAVEIPMQGQKESLNVSVAAGIALYHCRYN
jgi:23S rRNA (guanosine2251-2'-O)-methyltransferase